MNEATTGKIRKKRGWKVNDIDFDPAEGYTISWNGPSRVKFSVLLPIEIYGKKNGVSKIPMVKSKDGKARYEIPRGALKRPARGKSTLFYYSILLNDGKKMHYVHGSTPPKIIIWGSSAK